MQGGPRRGGVNARRLTAAGGDIGIDGLQQPGPQPELLAAEESGRSLAELTQDEVRSIAPELENADLAEALDPVRSIARRVARGGTAPDRVEEQLAALQERL